MSSVVISGDTSGAITLSAPAVAGTNTLTLPANTGTVITTASTFAGTGPAFLAYGSADTSIPNAVTTKILFQTETFDTNSNFASSRFTPTVAGYYAFTASIGWNTIGAGNLDMYIAKNATASIPDIRLYNPASSPPIMQGSYVWYMNGSTDYVEVFAYQGSGSTQSIIGGQDRTWFTGYLVRAA
jgi:hypothetical protein